MTTDIEIDVAGEPLRLMGERALYWPRTRTLIAADLHWGKAETFRASAIAVPAGSTAGDLARLDAALTRTGAERLLVLGDLWHARAGMSDGLFAELRDWRATRPALAIELVRGNHDRHAGAFPAALGIAGRAEPAVEGPFVFRHYPGEAAEGYVLAGHLHPGVVLRGRGRQRLRLPCFWFGGRGGVLPAFGGFTGAAEIERGAGDRVFAVADGEVIEVPTS